MAEFSEVMKQFERGCVREFVREGGCPFFPTCNIKYCRKIAFERPEEFERRVMDWAKAHPEPVYPTWAEWLISVGVLERTRVAFGGCDITSKVHETIPADIAEKLGIEPKEAT